MSNPPSRHRAVAANTTSRAVSLAREEAWRLDACIRLGSAALGAVKDRADHRSLYSARFRALGLEWIPHRRYLEHCSNMLRGDLYSARPLHRWAGAGRGRADELRLMLERIIELTATVDITYELDLPLELVSSLQTSARDGLSSIRRLEETLDGVRGAGQEELVAGLQSPAPAPHAQWLLSAASLLLPIGSRERYAEEFGSELRMLADEGARPRTQLAHAVRQLGTIWALRRALPSAPSSPGAEQSAVRVDAGARAATVNQKFGDDFRTVVDRWLNRREARSAMRRQAFARLRQRLMGPSPRSGQRGKHRSGRPMRRSFVGKGHTPV